MTVLGDLWRRWRVRLFGDPSVHDTLSCLALTMVGAGIAAATAATAAAEAASPAGAAAVVATSVWLPLVTGLAGGVAGNLATNVWQRLDRLATTKLLSGWKGIDENHVVVQALRRAHLDALRAVLKTFRDAIATHPERAALEAFADRVAAFTKVEWKAAERLAFRRPDTLTPAEDEIRRAVLDALPVNFGTALARRRTPPDGAGADPGLDDFRHALVAGALAEVRSRTLPEGEDLPPAFTALFRGEGAPDSWFDLFVRAAADRLKDEEAFAAIWNAEQQAHTQQLVAEVVERVERIDRMVGAPVRLGEASVARFKAAIRDRPTDLLVARYRVMPYLDRGGLLADALAWARRRDGSDARGRLYVAPGGYGKTRFAIELVLALTDQGWACTFLSDRNARNLAPGALAERVAGAGVPGRLVVLDYAESQITLLKDVAAAAAAAAPGLPIRVLALARSSEGWWQGTRADPGMASVFESASYDLIETPLSEDEQRLLFETGVVAFAAALAVADLPAPAVPASGLGHRFDRPLTVAMAAFLAARGAVPDPQGGVFEQVFVEERRHWQRVLKVEADNDPVVLSLHRAAAQVTLVQGATPQGAAALIAADPRAVAHGLPAQERTLAALERIYGDREGDTEFLRPIEPDLLGEHAAMAALAADHAGLIDVVFATALAGPPLFAVDVAAVLTVLTRATRQEHDVTTRTAARTAILRLATTVPHLDAAQVRQVEAACPRFATPLTEFAVAVARRLVETSDDDAQTAAALNTLAIRLGETGQRQEALAPAHRAVEIQEVLARDNSAAALPALAASLNNLANRLSETGQRQEALAPARRAVETYEALARDNPAAYLPVLAGSLNNLANRLSETGQRQEALAPARRAVEIREALARDNPAASLPDLAMSLNNLATSLSETGQRQEALAPARRAVEIREALARDNPAAYLPDVAMSLNNLAVLLSETGQCQEALARARRAVETYEALARDNPAASLPNLAMSLFTYGDVLRAGGDVEAAIPAYAEGLRAFCSCLASAPARFGPYVGTMADRLVEALTEAGRAHEIAPTLRGIMGDEFYEAYSQARSGAPEPPPPDSP